MNVKSRRRTGTRLVSLVAGLGLLGAACGQGGLPADPTDAVGTALEKTFENEYAFDFHIDVSDDAFPPGATQGPEAQFATIIKTLKVSGRIAPGEEYGTGRAALTISAMGSQFIEMVSINDGEEPAFSLRVDLSPLAAFIGSTPTPEQVLQQLQLQDAPQEVKELVTALVNGDWVTVTGAFEPSDFGGLGSEAPSIDPSEAASAAREALGGDIAGAIERFAVVTEREDSPEGTRIFDLELKVRELAEAAVGMIERFVGEEIPQEDLEEGLADAPETIGGLSVTTEGEVVTRLMFDVGEAARSAGEEGVEIAPGDVQVVFDLSDHGEIEAIESPDAKVTISSDDLAELFEQFEGQMGGGGEGVADVAAQSDLRNAAVVQESYYTDNATYTTDLSELEAAGFVPSEDVTLTIVQADAQGYCMEAQHAEGEVWHFSSTAAGLTQGPCP